MLYEPIYFQTNQWNYFLLHFLVIKKWMPKHLLSWFKGWLLLKIKHNFSKIKLQLLNLLNNLALVFVWKYEYKFFALYFFYIIINSAYNTTLICLIGQWCETSGYNNTEESHFWLMGRCQREKVCYSFIGSNNNN